MSSSPQPLPLVLCVSEAEASFFTLPYVEELLRLSELVEAAVPALPFAQVNRASTAYMVRLRMERERGYEEQLYNCTTAQGQLQGSTKREEGYTALRLRPASPAASSSSSAMSALWLLRVGLARALGLTVPAQDIPDADAALGRTHLYSTLDTPGAATLTTTTTAATIGAVKMPAKASVEDDVQQSEAGTAAAAAMIVSGLAACHTQHISSSSSSSSDDDDEEGEEDDEANAQCSTSTLYGYRECGDQALRETAVLEWFEDVLSFARQCRFGAAQTRCLLLNALGLLALLQDDNNSNNSNNNKDEEEELMQRVHDFLRAQLRSQACTTAHRVIEYETVCETVVHDRRDPDAVAALEQRMRKEKLNKKQQVNLREQLESLPSVATTTVQERTTPTERVVPCGPFFTPDEAQTMTAFLCEGVLRHWRLWRYCTAYPRAHNGEEEGEEEKAAVTCGPAAREMLVETVLRSGLPPLSAFLPAAVHGREVAREALWATARTALEALYERLFALPMAQTLRAMQAEQAALRETKERALRDNRACALVGDEYDRVSRAYTLRLEDALLHNARVGALAHSTSALSPSSSLLPPIAQAAAATRKSGKTTPTPKKARGGGATASRTASNATAVAGAARPSSRPTSALQSGVVRADSVVLPPDAVFELARMEQRVERIATTVQRQLAEAVATTTPALGSAGGARRRDRG